MSKAALLAVAQEATVRGPALLVAFRIADHTNRVGWAWPGVLLLADETGYSKDTVLRALKTLEEAGELHVERSKSRRGNRYRLRLRGIPGSDISQAPDQDPTGPGTVAQSDSSSPGNCRNNPPELSHHTPGTVAPRDMNLENHLNLATSSPEKCPACDDEGWVTVGDERGAPVARCGCTT